ncbi:hypothetical protein MVEN_02240100 [Mycena venus]|uniref:DUF6699 domain-containing protein n=1 Tax=Mycena venus TaxID=2733690 RepID=A0A8H6X642_9AGAR|nr:hypothetical protein MVEN_02240100 [Mycena venus]
MSATFASFGTTLSSGIQDLSAILSLFGTEECELHVESALRGGGRGGYIYAAITPLSIFGSLGVAKAAFGIFLASCSLSGARTLQNMGFEAKGDALAMLMLDKNHYKAESALLKLMDRHYIKRALHLSVVPPPILDLWLISLSPWDCELLLTSVLVACFGLAPYLHFFILRHTSFPPLALLFPTLRVVGGLLCVFPGQSLLQYRIERILKQRVLFKSINDLLKDEKLKMPYHKLWDESHTSEACLSSLHVFLGTLETPSAQEATAFIAHLSQLLDSPPNRDDVAMRLKKSYIADTWSWLIMLCALLVGILMTLVGYIGSFTIVQNSSTSSDTYIWLGAEAALAFIRILIWALNPTWDDSDGIRFRLDGQKIPPLHETLACSENHATKLKIVPETTFWEALTAYSGPLNVDQINKVPEFKHWYSWVRHKRDEILYLILEGEETILCRMEIGKDPDFHHARIMDSTSNAVHVIQQGILENDHPLMLESSDFKNNVFEHYFSILSVTQADDSFPIRASWPLSESSVEGWVAHIPKRRRHLGDPEQGTAGDDSALWLHLRPAINRTLEGMPLTFRQFKTSFGTISDHADSQVIYHHLSTHLSTHTKTIYLESKRVSGTGLVNFYNEKWRIYSNGALSLKRLFKPLNSNFVKRELDDRKKAKKIGTREKQAEENTTTEVSPTHESEIIDTVENVAFAHWRTNVLLPLSRRLSGNGMKREVNRVLACFMSRALTRDDVSDMCLDVVWSSEQTVETSLRQVMADPSVDRDLFSALHELAITFRGDGRNEDAMRADEEAGRLRETLETEDPGLEHNVPIESGQEHAHPPVRGTSPTIATDGKTTEEAGRLRETLETEDPGLGHNVPIESGQEHAHPPVGATSPTITTSRKTTEETGRLREILATEDPGLEHNVPIESGQEHTHLPVGGTSPNIATSRKTTEDRLRETLETEDPGLEHNVPIESGQDHAQPPVGGTSPTIATSRKTTEEAGRLRETLATEDPGLGHNVPIESGQEHAHPPVGGTSPTIANTGKSTEEEAGRLYETLATEDPGLEHNVPIESGQEHALPPVGRKSSTIATSRKTTAPIPPLSLTTLRKKEVRWKLTVDEYVIRNSPESWTSPLPVSSKASATVLIPPPPPQPNQDLPLPVAGALEFHRSLTPAQALQLDFSFPSDAFRRNPQLTMTLLNEPACNPPQSVVHLRISAGLHTVEFDVVHTPRGRTVTVGDVLTGIQAHLRQYDRDKVPPEAAPYKYRRIATVNGYCSARDRDARKESATIAAERQGGGRFVDRLLGHTLFAGLSPQLGQRDNYWQVQLAIPERYA